MLSSLRKPIANRRDPASFYGSGLDYGMFYLALPAQE